MASVIEWRDINKLLLRGSPFSNDTGDLPSGEFTPGPEVLENIQSNYRILVIGAGGLGCEILKGLALSGFRDIHVIDADTIDLTNLNRQFLFRRKDVGRPKAEVAAEFVNARVQGVTITPHKIFIQERDESFYRQFKLIIAGLDNVEARRWINCLLCSMVSKDDDGNISDFDSVIPLIDGGTEGFKGQARVILPQITSCFECSMDAFPKQTTFAMCTIADTPRKPEHCIAYAMQIAWPLAFPDRNLDKDSPDDMAWVCTYAQERGAGFGIEGVTYELTMGVVKNIIPAIASTNALISATCVGEALKFATFCSHSLNTYFMYMGSSGAYTHTFVYERKDGCVVCGGRKVTYRVPSATTLSELRERLIADATLQLTKPSLALGSRFLWVENPPALRAVLERNLSEPLSTLMCSGQVVTIQDPVFPRDAPPIELLVVFNESE